ncbi:unnamed protein product, partial [Rotaria magnacalcarata]
AGASYSGSSGFDSSSYGSSAGFGASAGASFGGGSGGYDASSAQSSQTVVQKYATDAQGLFQDPNPQ